MSLFDDQQFSTLVGEWHRLVKEIEEFKTTKMAREIELRRLIGGMLFPTPKEGVNKASAPGGWEVKFTYKLDYKVDEAVLPSALEQLQKLQVGTDGLIRRKPELVLKRYRELTEDQQKVLAEALVIKPSTPTLELVPPNDSKV